MTYYTNIESPLGTMLLTASERGLTGAYFVDQKYFKAVQSDWTEDKNQEFVAIAVRQFAEYFANRRQRFEVRMDLRGTPFQRRVWKALESIPYGSTVTYGEVARRVGMPAAVRAVGASVGRNPAGIIVPCHRVIGANGSLTGYAGGMDRKAALLRLEGAMASQHAKQEQLEIETLYAR